MGGGGVNFTSRLLICTPRRRVWLPQLSRSRTLHLTSHRNIKSTYICWVPSYGAEGPCYRQRPPTWSALQTSHQQRPLDPTCLRRDERRARTHSHEGAPSIHHVVLP